MTEAIDVIDENDKCSYCADTGWIWVNGVYCNQCPAGPALEAEELPVTMFRTQSIEDDDEEPLEEVKWKRIEDSNEW